MSEPFTNDPSDPRHEERQDDFGHHSVSNPEPLPEDPIKEEPRVERETSNNPKNGFFDSVIRRKVRQ
ncbi:MAG: hypothetical protein OXF83_05775 [Anaerolineaceae bacterium]|nr:hypothetical protein [Anaerolineaceae bacterium]MCY4009345.1 hypothetical protein [Anaerolineaceae bacterium]